jgi:hypothetical protein
MLQFPRDAPGSDALQPQRTAGAGDRTLLYGRPFKCKECGSPEVALVAIESQAELEAVRRILPQSDGLAAAPTNGPAG